MQRLHEGKMRKTWLQQKKEVICVQNSHLGSGKLFKHFAMSVVCDPSTWDLPHVYPKKRKKRKKEFPHGTTIKCASAT